MPRDMPSIRTFVYCSVAYLWIQREKTATAVWWDYCTRRGGGWSNPVGFRSTDITDKDTGTPVLWTWTRQGLI